MQTMMVMTMKLPMEPAQTSLAVMVPDMIRAAMATRLTQSVLTGNPQVEHWHHDGQHGDALFGQAVGCGDAEVEDQEQNRGDDVVNIGLN